MLRVYILFGLLLSAVVLASSSYADEFADDVQSVLSVKADGAGHQAAQAAAKRLSRVTPDRLVSLLTALDEASPLASNWLRGAFEGAADRASENFPKADVEMFFEDRAHNPQVRRLAFEWLAKADATATDRIVPKSLTDPSPEMRRDAVARLIKAAEALVESDKPLAIETYKQALTGAGDEDQVQAISKALEGLGEKIDLVKHFGFVTKWRLIGPFDNVGTKGFDVAYPPEVKVEVDAKYEGQKGEVTWKEFATDKPDGLFDINALTENHKGAITYAVTDFEFNKEQEVEFRLGTPNAWKMWINGDLVFAREEYHRGMFFDQYLVRGRLKPGQNTILLKVCQNEQTENWAQDWQFQFRICDLTGRAILATPPKVALAE